MALFSWSSQFFHGFGVEADGGQPTYVYPAEVKRLLRSVFSQNICDYADPSHHQVSPRSHTGLDLEPTETARTLVQSSQV